MKLPSEKRNERAAKRIQRRHSKVVESADLLDKIERLHWYALRTPAQKEFIAQEILTQKGLVTYCPTDKRWRRRNRFQKQKQLIGYAVIPRTVFVGFEPGIPLWFDIFALPAISSVVAINGKPMRLDSEGMRRLVSVLENGIQRPNEEKHMQTGKEFKAGDLVRVVDGPFGGIVVPVHEIRGREARVFLDLFGGNHEVSILTEYLEAA
jgi:transcription antitermination factor NusG